MAPDSRVLSFLAVLGLGSPCHPRSSARLLSYEKQKHSCAREQSGLQVRHGVSAVQLSAVKPHDPQEMSTRLHLSLPSRYVFKSTKNYYKNPTSTGCIPAARWCVSRAECGSSGERGLAALAGPTAHGRTRHQHHGDASPSRSRENGKPVRTRVPLEKAQRGTAGDPAGRPAAHGSGISFPPNPATPFSSVH